MTILDNKFHANDLGYWIDRTNELEGMFSEKYKINLDKITGKDYESVKESIRNKGLFYSHQSLHDVPKIKKQFKKMGWIDNNIPLNVDESKLEEIISKTYEKNFLHYILAKTHGYSGRDFPKGCCLYSSINMFFTEFFNSNPSAAVLWSYETKHAYNGQTFKLNNENGILISDPTSDQLGEHLSLKKEIPKNLIFIAKNKEFDYRVKDWSENDLSIVPDSLISIKELSESYFKDSLNMKRDISDLDIFS